MITGRINKELKEICLLDQAYVKAEDGKQTVAKYVEQVAKENGANVADQRLCSFRDRRRTREEGRGLCSGSSKADGKLIFQTT